MVLDSAFADLTMLAEEMVRFSVRLLLYYTLNYDKRRRG